VDNIVGFHNKLKVEFAKRPMILATPEIEWVIQNLPAPNGVTSTSVFTIIQCPGTI